jgi:hypothetical protein
MSYPGPIQWYHFQADLISPDGTFNSMLEFLNFRQSSISEITYNVI